MMHFSVIRLLVVSTALLSWSDATQQPLDPLMLTEVPLGPINDENESTLEPLESGLNVYNMKNDLPEDKPKYAVRLGVDVAERIDIIRLAGRYQHFHLFNMKHSVEHSVVALTEDDIYYMTERYDTPNIDGHKGIYELLSHGLFRKVKSLEEMTKLEPSLGPQLIMKFLQYQDEAFKRHIEQKQQLVKVNKGTNGSPQLASSRSVGSVKLQGQIDQHQGQTDQRLPEAESLFRELFRRTTSLVKRCSEQQPASDALSALLVVINKDLASNIGARRDGHVVLGHDATTAGGDIPVQNIVDRVKDVDTRLVKQNTIIEDIFLSLDTPRGTLKPTDEGMLNDIRRGVKQLKASDSKCSCKQATGLGQMLNLGLRSLFPSPYSVQIKSPTAEEHHDPGPGRGSASPAQPKPMAPMPGALKV